MPKIDCLQADCIQEESRLAARGNGQSSHNEENHVLATQAFRRKGREGRRGNFKRNGDRKSDFVPKPKKKDISHIQCFKCDKYGHYAQNYISKPKQHASIADVDDVSPQKESRDDSGGFLFISALSSNVPTDSDTLLIDSGASRHITGY